MLSTIILENCKCKFTVTFILLDLLRLWQYFIKVISVYQRCRSHNIDPSLTCSPNLTIFSTISIFSPFELFSFSGILLFPRDGEKSTELLIGSVNPDKRKWNAQVAIELHRKHDSCQPERLCGHGISLRNFH